MKNSKKMWALMVYLSDNQWLPVTEELKFDDAFWDEILEKSVSAGINTILLDVGDGVQYQSHPEIAMKGAWTPGRVHKEVEKCRKLGIALIPKLNFSTGHSYWMGDYRKMTSSPAYYQLCSDLIKEIYELFEAPEYIHLGYDEEVPLVTDKPSTDFVVYRKNALLMKDLKFLIEEVEKCGSTPWIWHDPLWEERHREAFLEYIGPKTNVVLSPWYYLALKSEHFKPIPRYNEDGTENVDYQKGIRYEEEIYTEVINYLLNEAVSFWKEGYRYVPTVSTYCKTDYNTYDMVEHFAKNAPSEEQLVGFLTAPWVDTLPEYREVFEYSLELLKKAREKFCPDQDGFLDTFTALERKVRYET